MESQTENIRRKSRLLHIASLGIISTLILSILSLINLALKTQENDARVINTSGRQRTFSQNITKYILIAESNPNDQYNLERLKKITQTFKTAHHALQFGNDSLGIPPCRSEHILGLFDIIRPDYEKLTTAADMVLASPNDPNTIAKAKLLAVRNDEDFLRAMDTIVNSFEKEAKEKIIFIEYLEIGLGIIALIILGSVYLFILRPLAIKTYNANKNLNKLNITLNESVAQLEEVTQSLSEEIEERKTAEEKLIQNQDALSKTNKKLEESHHQLKHTAAELEEEVEERKATENKLKKNQEELEKLALIASKTHNAVIICNSKGKIEWVNTGFERITEYTLNEVIGQKPGDFLQGEDTDPETVNLISEKLKKGKGFTTDIINYSKSGRKYWVRIELQPIRNIDGNVTKFIAIESDITERKKNEVELKQAKENAERSAMAKQEFLSTMSHEIRTPMNAVVGLTHILLTGSPKPEQIENLKALKFSADTLLALINDILDLSKIESGKIEFEQTEFSVREIITSIEKSLGVISKEKGITILTEVDKNVPEAVKGDQIRLNQILTNLVNNAIKFTEKGHVKITVENISSKLDTINLRFKVQDTGIGISPEQSAKIFERFSQAHQNTTRLYGGTGLGLAITKQLVELQNGKIWVESQVDKGSTFYFELSYMKGKANKKTTSNETDLQAKKLQGLHVLLVEDNPMNHLVAQQFLNKWGVSMKIAETGEEALERILDQSFDMVLMDLNMPGIDGFDTSIRIRSMGEDYFKKIPIIALTASAFSEVKKKVFEHGMNDHVSKPFDPTELYNKLIKHAQSINELG